MDTNGHQFPEKSRPRMARITGMSGGHPPRGVGLKAWPSLRVRCSGSPKQSFSTEGNEGNEGFSRPEPLFSLLSSV